MCDAWCVAVMWREGAILVVHGATHLRKSVVT